MVKGSGQTPHWVSFQYERLLILFCYWCGVLNHDKRDCKLWLNRNGTLRKEDQQYGAWLRASMAKFQRSRPTMPHEENRVNNENSTRTMSNTRLLLTLIIAKGDDDEMRSHGGVANDNLNTLKVTNSRQVPTENEILSNPVLFNHYQ